MVGPLTRPPPGRSAGGGRHPRPGESDHGDRFGGKYSVVKAQYRFGDTTGSLGVIGPKRMDYAYVITLVEYLAGLLSGTAPDA